MEPVSVTGSREHQLYPGVMASRPEESTSVEPVRQAQPVMLVAPFLVTKFRPVAAGIVGGGTSSVVPAGALGVSVPEGAILVAQADELTTTGVSWPA